MPRVSLAFFTAAALCGLSGMVWGVIMGVTTDFSMSPAHAHLNLVGWATLALMGVFYALARPSGRLPWINFALSTVGVTIMVPALALFLKGNAAAEQVLIGSTVFVILGMATFLYAVLSHWRRPAAV